METSIGGFLVEVMQFNICRVWRVLCFPFRTERNKVKHLSTSSGGDSTEDSLQSENVHHVFYMITSKIRLNVTWGYEQWVYSWETLFDIDTYFSVLYNWRHLKSSQGAARQAWEEHNLLWIWSEFWVRIFRLLLLSVHIQCDHMAAHKLTSWEEKKMFSYGTCCDWHTEDKLCRSIATTRQPFCYEKYPMPP